MRSVADDLRRGQNPFPVNSLALVGGLVAIQHAGFARRYAAEVCANRATLCRWLEDQEIPYVPSQANFVLTRLGPHAPAIARRLRARGILVRDWNYDPRLRGFLRFTIGSTAQTRRLMRELRQMRDLIEARASRKDWSKFATFSATGWFA